ncbi:MAG: tetratricopeptide repeat protein, partial [bacterium]|nr:tetratricopeptide repeat protein [bacterium]
ESCILEYTADLLLDRSRLNKAISLYNQAIIIADEIRNPENQNQARCGLALALLYSGDLPGARGVIEEARQYNYPPNNHRALTVLGMTALLQRDPKPAREAFMAALAEVETLLEHCDRNYKALDSRGLALCGMALLEKKNDYISDAREALKSARELTRAAGVVNRVARMFEELKKADDQGILESDFIQHIEIK